MTAIRAFALLLLLGAASTAGSHHASAQVSEIDYQMATSAIMAAGSRAARVAAVSRVPSVGVIRLDVRRAPVFASDARDPAEFRIMAKRNAGGVRKLQRALRSNPATREALSRRGIDAAQVAGAQISSNGSLRLYIFSRSHALR